MASDGCANSIPQGFTYLERLAQKVTGQAIFTQT
jgi:hypothetical protein